MADVVGGTVVTLKRIGGSDMSQQMRQTKVWKAFRACPAWRGADDGQVQELIERSAFESFRKNDVIVRPGDPVAAVIVVVAGHLRTLNDLSTLGDDHTGAVSTLFAWHSDCMGLALVFADRPWSLFVIASEKSRVAFVPSDAIRALVASSSRVAESMLATCSEVFLRVLAQAQNVRKPTESRVALVLLHNRRPPLPCGKQLADLRMRRVELAAALCTTPETLSRSFARLQEERIIRADGGPIVEILDEGRLRDLAYS